MKKNILYLFSIVLLLMAATFSCKEESVSGIILEPKLLYICGTGKTKTFTFKIIPANATNKKVS
jgi:hypothetical protein